MVVLDEADERNWAETEQMWIAALKGDGYRLTNLTDGGEGLSGYKMTQAHKDRIGLAHRGKTIPPEALSDIAEKARLRLTVPENLEAHRRRIREALSRPDVIERMKASAHARSTPEYRRKVAQTVKRLWSEGVYKACSGHTDETREVIRAKAKARLKNRKDHPRARPVMVNGKRYDTRRDACDAIGIAYQTMSYWLKTGKATYADATD